MYGKWRVPNTVNHFNPSKVYFLRSRTSYDSQLTLGNFLSGKMYRINCLEGHFPGDELSGTNFPKTVQKAKFSRETPHYLDVNEKTVRQITPPRIIWKSYYTSLGGLRSGTVRTA
uniref:Uncharacterized protein n=1 Tax=Romanomermis culicivorax TaxID=13658 RepID=A0A915KSK9_ROMCU